MAMWVANPLKNYVPDSYIFLFMYLSVGIYMGLNIRMFKRPLLVLHSVCVLTRWALSYIHVCLTDSTMLFTATGYQQPAE